MLNIFFSLSLWAAYDVAMVDSQPVKKSEFSDPLSDKYNDEVSVKELEPALFQIKTLKNYLVKSAIPDLYKLYGYFYKESNAYWPKAKKLESMELKLRTSNTLLESLENINHFLKKYNFHLKQLLHYQLQNDHVDFTRRVARRATILSILKEFLNLAQVEVADIISNHASTEDVDEIVDLKKFGFHKLLVKVPASGNYGQMEMIDTYFVDHLRRYLEVVIYFLEYRLSVESIILQKVERA